MIPCPLCGHIPSQKSKHAWGDAFTWTCSRGCFVIRYVGPDTDYSTVPSAVKAWLETGSGSGLMLYAHVPDGEVPSVSWRAPKGSSHVASVALENVETAVAEIVCRHVLQS